MREVVQPNRQLFLVLVVAFELGVAVLILSRVRRVDAGLPSYYQQYSNLQMIWVDSLVLIPIAAIAYFFVKRLRPERRLTIALWLAFYFTVPLAVFDWLYCGLYLHHGVQFLSEYWYLTVYYAIPWLLLPLIALLVDRTGSGQMENPG